MKGETVEVSVAYERKKFIWESILEGIPPRTSIRTNEVRGLKSTKVFTDLMTHYLYTDDRLCVSLYKH